MYDEKFDSNREQGKNAYTILCLFVLASLLSSAVFYFTPARQLLRHFRYYGKAEAVAADLQTLVGNLDVINESTVRSQLATERFPELESMEIEIRLNSGEMIWFKANDMFNIGLADDGAILWMVDGARSPTGTIR